MSKEVFVDQLDDGKVVCSLEPGDVILRRDGEQAVYLHAIQHGFIFDQGNGYAEVFYAPLWSIKRIILPIDTIMQTAEWLHARHPARPAQRCDPGAERNKLRKSDG